MQGAPGFRHPFPICPPAGIPTAPCSWEPLVHSLRQPEEWTRKGRCPVGDPGISPGQRAGCGTSRHARTAPVKKVTAGYRSPSAMSPGRRVRVTGKGGTKNPGRSIIPSAGRDNADGGIAGGNGRACSRADTSGDRQDGVPGSGDRAAARMSICCAVHRFRNDRVVYKRFIVCLRILVCCNRGVEELIRPGGGCVQGDARTRACGTCTVPDCSSCCDREA